MSAVSGKVMQWIEPAPSCTIGDFDFLIQFGGDMYAAGREGDRAWKLGIQDPRGPANRIFATVDVSDSTFSTSGDYARSFLKDGRPLIVSYLVKNTVSNRGGISWRVYESCAP